MMNRLLVVAYYTPPLGLSGVMRVTKLCKFLPEFGWEPVILTIKPVAYYAYDPALLEDLKKAKVFRTEIFDPNRLFWILGKRGGGGFNFIRPSRHIPRGLFFPDSKIGWLPFALSRGRGLLKEFNPRAVFATAPPWTALIVGARLAQVKGVPFIADFRDPWPDGFIPPVRWQRPFLERLRCSILKRAQGIIAVNQGTAEVVLAGGMIDRQVEILENGFDPDDFAVPAERLSGFSILYAGNLFENRSDLEVFLAVLNAVPDARFYIAGGVDRDSVEVLAKHPRVQMLGVLAHQRVAALMKGADVLLYIGKPGQPVGLKLYEYLGSGRPILVWGRGSREAGELVQEIGAGLVGEDADGLVRCLEEIRRTPGRFTGGNRERFNRRFQAKRLADYLERLI